MRFRKIFIILLVGFIFLPFISQAIIKLQNINGVIQGIEVKNKPRPEFGQFYSPILMYHHIAKRKIHNPYSVSPEIFYQQMQWLKDNDYQVVSLDDFYYALKNKTSLPDKPVIITFDDGNLDNYLAALPVLKALNYPATFFIQTKVVGKDGYMTWKMVNQLVKEKMTVGSHTASHRDLKKLSAREIDYELLESKGVLEKNLKIEIKYLAYPGGSYSDLVIDKTKKAGYLLAVTTEHKVYHDYQENLYLIPRIHIDDDLNSFIDYVKGINLN